MQTERLLKYLKIHKTITPFEAWDKLGIYRLADVCFKLRKQGHDIKTNRVSVKNRFKEDCRIARYRYES